MKKYILRVIALLILTSAAFTSCSVEYRQQHGKRHDNGRHEGEHHDRNQR